MSPSTPGSAPARGADAAPRPGNAAGAAALLRSPQGRALLDALPAYDEADALTLGARLRTEGHDPALVAAALTQQRLRSRAAEKLGPLARTALLTPDGLEQATRRVVAAQHAERFRAAGARKVADLGCGIGGDAMAMAGLGLSVLAVERDEATAALAAANLAAFPGAEVRCADALSIDVVSEGVDAVFADPARRSGGRRIADPEQWSPALSRVLALRGTVGALGVKVAPGIDHALIPPDAHAQWVSVDGDLVEAGIWCGPLAIEGPGRSAAFLSTRGAEGDDGDSVGDVGDVKVQVLTDPGCSDPSVPPEQLPPVADADALGSWIHEPDGAVIRAGLVAEVARRLGARPVGERIAYLTGDEPVGADLAPFVRSWRLVEVLPLHLKALRAHVREQGVGRLEILKRGVDTAPETLRKQMRLAGPGSETWILTRVGQHPDRGTGTGRARLARGAVLVVECAGAPA